MLDIYPVCQQVAQDAVKVAKLVAQHDRDLANQLSRAACSVPLNVAEGSYSRGGNRSARYHTAMGSAAEVRAVLELAEGLGWVERDDARRAKLDRIVGTLVRVLRLG
jgi:four helix bundle protein